MKKVEYLEMGKSLAIGLTGMENSKYYGEYNCGFAISKARITSKIKDDIVELLMTSFLINNLTILITEDKRVYLKTSLKEYELDIITQVETARDENEGDFTYELTNVEIKELAMWLFN